MVRRAAVPYVEGLDFRAEFHRQEDFYDDDFSLEEKKFSAKKREKIERREKRAIKRSPLPIPPAQAIVVGRPAKKISF